MKGFIDNIEQLTLENSNFRRVLYTTKFSQLVLMSIPPGEEIGEETHELDQFFRFEQGTGKAVLNGIEHAVASDTGLIVPEGTKHNIINTGSTDLKLYTIYSPPNHKDGTVHATREAALANEEHWDGKTSE